LGITAGNPRHWRCVVATTDETRATRRLLAAAAREYRAAAFEDPEKEQAALKKTASKYGVTMKELQAAADAGA
jgi:hypothetical protein